MNIESKIRKRLKMQHKSDSTADVYCHWVRRYFAFCKEFKIGSETKAEHAVEDFLTHLANRERVSANTQNQAFSAICYMYRDVLKRPLVDVSALRAKRPQRTRDACDQHELQAIFAELKGLPLLAVRMMYGSGLRIGELACIRMKDIDFRRKQIHIWNAKGAKDRVVQFPEVLHAAVAQQMESIKVLWKSDVSDNLNGVSLPHAWGRKSPSSRLDFAWYYLFAADRYSRCPHTGKLLRHHRDVGGFAKALKLAVRRAGIPKRITAHCLRHSFATHALEGGMPIHVLKELMGHTHIETTETYLHVQKDQATSAKSPIESLPAEARNDAPIETHTSPTLRLFAG